MKNNQQQHQPSVMANDVIVHPASSTQVPTANEAATTSKLQSWVEFQELAANAIGAVEDDNLFSDYAVVWASKAAWRIDRANEKDGQWLLCLFRGCLTSLALWPGSGNCPKQLGHQPGPCSSWLQRSPKPLLCKLHLTKQSCRFPVL